MEACRLIFPELCFLPVVLWLLLLPCQVPLHVVGVDIVVGFLSWENMEKMGGFISINFYFCLGNALIFSS